MTKELDNRTKAFCTECEEDVDFDVKVKHNVPRLIAGKTYISRDFYICTCAKCGGLVTVDEYEKANWDEIKKQTEVNNDK
nr:MAG TPA: HTH-type transcriptional regulator [Caudoviricetes sp.]